MGINWDEVQKSLSPVKDYEDLCHRFAVSFRYGFVCAKFNFSLPQLIDYTQKLLLGDARNRYVDYHARLLNIMTHIEQAGVKNVFHLAELTASPEKLEGFVDQFGVSAPDTIFVLKFLVYWFIPGEKYLSGLLPDNPELVDAIKVLRQLGVRTNLDMLEQGLTPETRQALADQSGLPNEMVTHLVNRADFSRLPWASKATISNIIGAGYHSLSQLANANPDRLYEDFFRYGESIGKNLKLGNEIENSYRIARIVPVILEEG